MVHADGTVSERAGCTEPRPPPALQQSLPDPCDLGWSHAAPLEAFYQHSKDVAVFNATYTVPQTPTDPSATLFYWIGLQALNSTANPVIQPVLSWEDETWFFESWNCCPAGHKVKAASVPIAKPGDVLRGTMTRDLSRTTEATGASYTITSSNGAGAASVLIVDDATIEHGWNWVDLVLETYNVASCDQYASGTARFLDMALLDIAGAAIVPKWTQSPYIDGWPGPLSPYMSPTEGKAFTACCAGSLELDWPSATMRQNG